MPIIVPNTIKEAKNAVKNVKIKFWESMKKKIKPVEKAKKKMKNTNQALVFILSSRRSMTFCVGFDFCDSPNSQQITGTGNKYLI